MRKHENFLLHIRHGSIVSVVCTGTRKRICEGSYIVAESLCRESSSPDVER